MIYTIEISQENNKREYNLEVSRPLLFLGDISDEIVIIGGHATLYRKIGISKYGKSYLLETPKLEELISGQDTNIELFDGDNQIRIIGSNGKSYIKYLLKNDFNETFATKVELSTSITQANDRITLVARKTVGKNEVISSINQSPEEITIKANKLNFQGKTFNLTAEDMGIVSNNFSVDKWGNMTANNGNFRGNINGSSISGGSITGTSVSASSISGGSINGSYLNGNSINGGSITIGANFLVNNQGKAQLSNSTGYLSFLSSLHPYVSALNIARSGLNAISFRDATNQNSVGNQIANIGITNGGDALLTFKSNTGMQFITGNTAYIYLWSQVKLVADGSASCWATGNGGKTGRIQTDGGNASSKILKKNIKKFSKLKYQKALDILNSINIYDYEYKYNLYDKRKQYGFIIDEIEEIDGYENFFDFTDEYAQIDGENIDPSVMEQEKFNKNSKEIVHYKQYDTNVLDKYLLTCVKGLQQEVNNLKEELKSIKEVINGN